MERKVLRPRRATKALLAITAAALIGTAFTGCSAAGGDSTASGGVQPLTMYNDNPQWKDGFVKAGDEIAKTTGYSLNPIALPSTANYTQTVLTSLPTEQVRRHHQVVERRDAAGARRHRSAAGPHEAVG